MISRIKVPELPEDSPFDIGEIIKSHKQIDEAAEAMAAADKAVPALIASACRQAANEIEELTSRLSRDLAEVSQRGSIAEVSARAAELNSLAVDALHNIGAKAAEAVKTPIQRTNSHRRSFAGAISCAYTDLECGYLAAALAIIKRKDPKRFEELFDKYYRPVQ